MKLNYVKKLYDEKKIGSLSWDSSQIVLHRKENTSIIKILLDQEQKNYTGGCHVEHCTDLLSNKILG